MSYGNVIGSQRASGSRAAGEAEAGPAWEEAGLGGDGHDGRMFYAIRLRREAEHEFRSSSEDGGEMRSRDLPRGKAGAE